MKTIHKRLAPIVALVLLSVFLLTACGDSDARVIPIYTFDPGPAFSTNFINDDARRQIKCMVVFEVIDEAAVLELEAFRFIIRNSVIAVLGSLTTEELHTERDLDVIAERIVDRVNADLQGVILSSSDDYRMITRAYFTDFAIV